MRWFGILVAVVVGVAPMGFAQDDQIARAQVLALEKAWNQAYKAGDIKALSSILDNSLVLVEDDGSLKTKSEFLASVKASNANDEQVAPESLTVRVFGSTAIAIGVIAVKEAKGGKMHCGAPPQSILRNKRPSLSSMRHRRRVRRDAYP